MQPATKPTQPIDRDTLADRATEYYERELRAKVETPENIGKLLVLDVESGDYEIDEMGIETSKRLQVKHPGAMLFAIKIGYKTAVSFCGSCERSDPL